VLASIPQARRLGVRKVRASQRYAKRQCR